MENELLKNYFYPFITSNNTMNLKSQKQNMTNTVLFTNCINKNVKSLRLHSSFSDRKTYNDLYNGNICMTTKNIHKIIYYTFYDDV